MSLGGHRIYQLPAITTLHVEQIGEVLLHFVTRNSSYTPCMNYVQYERGCVVPNQAHHQYKRECAEQARHIISKSEDVQYELGTSSVQVRMCNTSKVDHQVLGQGLLLKDTFERTDHYSC